jgi:hypothetical protein
MKRTTTKLQLKKSTIRLLQVGELADVNGGAPTNQQVMCSHSCHCPPKTQHPPGPGAC